MHSTEATIELDAAQHTVYCAGDWCLAGLGKLLAGVDLNIDPTKNASTPSTLVLNLAKVQRFDTTGGWLLLKWVGSQSARGINIDWAEVSEVHGDVLSLLRQHQGILAESPPAAKPQTILTNLGRNAVRHVYQAYGLLSYIGRLARTRFGGMPAIGGLQIRETVHTIFQTGFTALPIIGLLSFLVGIVLAYQMGIQLQHYGANIYIVDLLGLAILREFGPLMTAVIVAGRTSSAFTAEIATMMVTQEVDALKSLGLKPTNILVLPKMIGLLLALPLLVFWADCFGVLGGAWVAHHMLNLSYHDFFLRFRANVSLASFMIGLGKGPVFALIIAMVGTFQGFLVKGGAQAVGQKTTHAVVQSIFLIIIADAIISVLYGHFGV